jgi:hypothetical protein
MCAAAGVSAVAGRAGARALQRQTSHCSGRADDWRNGSRPGGARVRQPRRQVLLARISERYVARRQRQDASHTGVSLAFWRAGNSGANGDARETPARVLRRVLREPELHAGDTVPDVGEAPPHASTRALGGSSLGCGGIDTRVRLPGHAGHGASVSVAPADIDSATSTRRRGDARASAARAPRPAAGSGLLRLELLG